MTFGDVELLTQMAQCKETERAASQPSSEPCRVFKQQQERYTGSQDQKDKKTVWEQETLAF